MKDPSWHEANHEFLMAELDRLARFLRDDANGSDLGTSCAAASSMDPQPPLLTLSETFGLSNFERDLVLACAGVELDTTFAKLCSQDSDTSRRHPTFSLMLERFPHAHWSALSPGARLRASRFIELRDPTSLTSSPIILDERILHHIVGVDDLDERLTRHVTGPMRRDPLVASHFEMARRIVALWTVDDENDLPAVVQLVGDDPTASSDVAASACGSIGLSLWTTSPRTLPHTTEDIETFTRLWEREAAIANLALLIECDDQRGHDAELRAAVDRIASEIGGYVLLAVPERRSTIGRRGLYAIDVKRPTEAEQHSLWEERLGIDESQGNEVVAELVAHFDLSSKGITAACTESKIEDLLRDSDNEATPIAAPSVVWEACRTQSRSDMADLARRIDASAAWDDLVVTDAARTALESIVLHVRHRSRVYREWGFAGTSDRGRGVSALFAGPSGTGKTMAAEVLATELSLDLYAIDLSALVSKYIGETEKNLRRVFDTAESSGAILLFDEADALFGKRSEVHDSHDRHANIEVSYLLQRMERYRGIAILTSNMRDALDPAFTRRLSFIVDFQFPSPAMRIDLWSRAFPPATPVKDLDSTLLAQLEVSGAQTRNIARAAAFFAAGADEPVTMEHIRRGAALEYSKTERHIAPGELKGWP